MSYRQLLLDFSRQTLRQLRLLPKARGRSRSATKPAPVVPTEPKGRDPILEQLSRQLLDSINCRELSVHVGWNARLRTTAGLACYRRRSIFLNPRLLQVDPGEIQRTLRHELAHFVAQHRAGRRRISAHGPEWRQACRDLGIPNEPRCHDLPFKRARMTRRYFYECRQCHSPLARVRPLRRRVACLKCCRLHNQGQYHDRFRFVQVAPPSELAA